jgi:Zn ribbon nucleic-acid-binding protein
MDKIVVNLDTDQRECVACGFSEERPDTDQAATQFATTTMDTGPIREVPTRVSRAAARRVETPAQAITLIDSTADGK